MGTEIWILMYSLWSSIEFCHRCMPHLHVDLYTSFQSANLCTAVEPVDKKALPQREDASSLFRDLEKRLGDDLDGEIHLLGGDVERRDESEVRSACPALKPGWRTSMDDKTSRFLVEIRKSAELDSVVNTGQEPEERGTGQDVNVHEVS